MKKIKTLMVITVNFPKDLPWWTNLFPFTKLKTYVII